MDTSRGVQTANAIKPPCYFCERKSDEECQCIQRVSEEYRQEVDKYWAEYAKKYPELAKVERTPDRMERRKLARKLLGRSIYDYKRDHKVEDVFIPSFTMFANQKAIEYIKSKEQSIS